MNTRCSEYHVAWLRNGTIRLTNCLQTQPRWMAERRNILGSLPMSRAFLPGTHDSASYAIHERANNDNIVEKYVITQVDLGDLATESQNRRGARTLVYPSSLRARASPAKR